MRFANSGGGDEAGNACFFLAAHIISPFAAKNFLPSWVMVLWLGCSRLDPVDVDCGQTDFVGGARGRDHGGRSFFKFRHGAP